MISGNDLARYAIRDFVITGVVMFAAGAVIAFGVAYWLTPPDPHFQEIPARESRP